MGLYEQLLSEEDKQKEVNKVKAFIKKRYPKTDFSRFEIRFSKKKLMEIVAICPRGGETKILLDSGSGLRQDFLDKTYVQDAIGPSA